MYSLILGDCLQEMNKLIASGIKVDMVLTDPPYGTTACKWDSVIPFEPMWERIWKLVKPNGAVCLFGNEPFSSFLRCSNVFTYRYDWIWYKSRATNFLFSSKQPMKRHENISTFYKSQPSYNPIMELGNKNHKMFKTGVDKKEVYEQLMDNTITLLECKQDGLKFPKTVLEFPNIPTGKNVHPTQKPVALLEYLVKTYTNEGDTVLDFTMGSGSTGVACVNTNRNFIGIELDQKYYDIAKSRLEEAKKMT